MEVDKDLVELLDGIIAPYGNMDAKAFEHFYDKYAEQLENIGEPADEGDDCECPMDDDEHEPDCNAGSWSAWSDSTLKHKIFTYGPTRPDGIGNYPKDKSDLPYVLAYQAEFSEDLIKEIEKYSNEN